ncbi:uncharacterized protein F4822DRAFT_338635 [Hypoxylon trugodes]|uniref:uncharacterized protein n=1 Tax=Hypoxylon trugodes TaxID=326681 RepID=UPI0021A0810C|nr:uncharacterized protein F4822DRAFT_338635 [Hypoxylon trugodes]KAI1385247.1 hypothetical protein F4822DRAFT_338635 [Hypoxylon trugodes]
MTSKIAAKVELVPWDHTSDAHRERLVQQRIGCGWMEDAIEAWRDMTVKGTKTMYWILLADDYPDRDGLIAAHTKRYPQEAIPIVDSASIHWGLPRQASQQPIIPIGHIGLGLRPEKNVELGLPARGSVWIGPLYVSWALQGTGLGRATMRAAESLALSPVFNAETTALDAITEKSQFDPGLLELHYFAKGNPKPAVSNEAWYRKQGYEEFAYNPDSYSWLNTKTGEQVPLPSIFFKKSLKG